MHQEQDHYIADSKEDFVGWEILLIEDWKPGIKRVSMRKIKPMGWGSFLIVFSKDEYIEGLSVYNSHSTKSNNL